MKLLILWILFVCCDNKKESNKIYDNTSNSETVIPKINTDLLTELYGFINEEEFYYDEYKKADSGMCFVLEFLQEKEDTVVIISYNMCWMDHSGYKGIINVDKYDIAILDKENVGLNCYNIDSLINKEISNLRCNDEKSRSIAKVKMKGAEIISDNRWGFEGLP